MDNETKFFMITVTALSIALVTSIVGIVFGLDFNYHLTKQMNEETRILALCFHSDLTIPDCNMISARINTTYGDKLN